jgi:CheY-like chemotaxis protein
MRSVLLVDDSGIFEDVGEALLRRTHCELLTASNGTEALQVARREKPELICLDAKMNGMTGIDVCRVLKADPVFSHTPVLIACEDDASREEASRAGATGVLARPPDEAGFFDGIRRYMRVFPRDEARSAVGWALTFWRDGVQYEGSIRDLSRGGLFVRTPVRLPIGARIEISFDVPGDKPGRTVVAEAIVVRAGQEPDRGMGCRFFRLTSSARGHLEECLSLLELGEVAR